MTHWLLSLKRLLRPGTAILLLLIVLTVWGGREAGRSAELRPCGVVCEDTDFSLRDALTAKGFVPFASREEMEHAISRGTLDCGAVLLPGLGQALENGEYAGFVQVLTAPDSFLPEVYEAHIHASLYSAAAPAVTVQSAREAGVALEIADVREELARLRSEGLLFSFEIVTAQGAPAAPRDLGRAVSQAAAALLLFAAVTPGTVRAARWTEELKDRIGRKAAVMSVLIPTLFWQSVLYFLAAAMAGNPAAMAGYILLLTALGLAAARLPFRTYVFLPVCLLGGLAVYPVYFDLGIPLALRCLLPPCWLLAAIRYPAAAMGLGAGLTALLLVFYPKRRHL